MPETQSQGLSVQMLAATCLPLAVQRSRGSSYLLILDLRLPLSCCHSSRWGHPRMLQCLGPGCCSFLWPVKQNQVFLALDEMQETIITRCQPMAFWCPRPLPPSFGFLAQRNLLFGGVYSARFGPVVLTDCKWKGKLLSSYSVNYTLCNFPKSFEAHTSQDWLCVGLKSSEGCICTSSERTKRKAFTEQITTFMKIRAVQFTVI